MDLDFIQPFKVENREKCEWLLLIQINLPIVLKNGFETFSLVTITMKSTSSHIRLILDHKIIILDRAPSDVDGFTSPRWWSAALFTLQILFLRNKSCQLMMCLHLKDPNLRSEKSE